MEKEIKTTVGLLVIALTAFIATFSIILANQYWIKKLADQPEARLSVPQKKVCSQEAQLCPDGQTYVSRTGAECQFAACPEMVGVKDKLIVSSPSPDETVSSPVALTGRAVGGWFFEASFPVSIEDAKGKVLGKGIANFVPAYPNEEWMTGNFVNFKAELKFSAPSTETGTITFSKDNPSGNPALDETFRLPVKFSSHIIYQKSDPAYEPSPFGGRLIYQNDKYGFEVEYPNNWNRAAVNMGGRSTNLGPNVSELGVYNYIVQISVYDIPSNKNIGKYWSSSNSGVKIYLYEPDDSVSDIAMPERRFYNIPLGDKEYVNIQALGQDGGYGEAEMVVKTFRFTK